VSIDVKTIDIFYDSISSSIGGGICGTNFMDFAGIGTVGSQVGGLPPFCVDALRKIPYKFQNYVKNYTKP
jgi:hypothetical protein